MEEYKTLEVLENRIKKLEAKIIAKGSLDEVRRTQVKPVLNALHEVDTVLISTLSGREKISSLMKKVDLLEEICDPSYLESYLNSDSKLETILTCEYDLIYFNQVLQRVEELDSVLNKDNIEKLTSMSGRLSKLTTNILQFKEECDIQTAEVKRLVHHYKQSIEDLTKLFADVELLITKLEEEPVKSRN